MSVLFFSTILCLFFLLPDMFVGGKLETDFSKLMVVTCYKEEWGSRLCGFIRSIKKNREAWKKLK